MKRVVVKKSQVVIEELNPDEEAARLAEIEKEKAELEKEKSSDYVRQRVADISKELSGDGSFQSAVINLIDRLLDAIINQDQTELELLRFQLDEIKQRHPKPGKK